ncbi:MAG: LysM peptidoglycan-binding domain-containing protein [Actinomycetes bacterium]
MTHYRVMQPGPPPDHHGFVKSHITARALPAFAVVAVLAGLGGALVLAGAEPPVPPSAFVRSLRAAGPDAAVVQAATLGAWACLGWVALISALVTVSRLPGLSGRVATALVRRAAPAALRRALEAALGITVLAMPCGPALSGPVNPFAVADVQPPVPTWPVPSLDRPASSGDYVVQPGDCLWAIARRQLGDGATTRAIALTWPQWYAANRASIGPDPNVLRPGQRLRVPISGGVSR